MISFVAPGVERGLPLALEYVVERRSSDGRGGVADQHPTQTIYVAGFVTVTDSGGFEWRTDRDDLEEICAGWLEAGDRDVSPIRSLDRPAGTDEEVTHWLSWASELWEPRIGERGGEGD